MRAGTQTLIQALQAIPWTEDADNEDETQHDVSDHAGKADTDSEDEAHTREYTSASTIHTARSFGARSNMH
jgi:sterol 3beta-glucosyltransferase